MQWPFVKRKKYEEEKRKASGRKQRIRSLEEDIKTANEVVDQIVPRLVRIKTYKDREYNTWRVCAELHRDVVERGFHHGGSEREIEYVAESITRDIFRKMMQFNFARCNRQGGH